MPGHDVSEVTCPVSCRCHAWNHANMHTYCVLQPRCPTINYLSYSYTVMQYANNCWPYHYHRHLFTLFTYLLLLVSYLLLLIDLSSMSSKTMLWQSEQPLPGQESSQSSVE